VQYPLQAAAISLMCRPSARCKRLSRPVLHPEHILAFAVSFTEGKPGVTLHGSATCRGSRARGGPGAPRSAAHDARPRPRSRGRARTRSTPEAPPPRPKRSQGQVLAGQQPILGSEAQPSPGRRNLDCSFHPDSAARCRVQSKVGERDAVVWGIRKAEMDTIIKIVRFNFAYSVTRCSLILLASHRSATYSPPHGPAGTASEPGMPDHHRDQRCRPAGHFLTGQRQTPQRRLKSLPDRSIKTVMFSAPTCGWRSSRCCHFRRPLMGRAV
jgi:hypothetical protein